MRAKGHDRLWRVLSELGRRSIAAQCNRCAGAPRECGAAFFRGKTARRLDEKAAAPCNLQDTLAFCKVLRGRRSRAIPTRSVSEEGAASARRQVSIDQCDCGAFLAYASGWYRSPAPLIDTATTTAPRRRAASPAGCGHRHRRASPASPPSAFAQKTLAASRPACGRTLRR